MRARAGAPNWALALALATVVVATAGLPSRAQAAHGGTNVSAKAPYQLVDVDGIKALLRKARGHVVLVHFWASWCGPCLQELPLMNRFAKEMKPRGLEVLSLSLDNPASMAARVGALLQRSAPNLTPNIAQFTDADDLIAAVDPRWAGAIPALFVYDHQGQLRGNIIGEASRAELEQLVTGLLKAAAGASPPTSKPSSNPTSNPPAAAAPAAPSASGKPSR